MSQGLYIEKWIVFDGEQRLVKFKDLDITERLKVLNEIQIEVATGELTFGKAVRRLRKDVTGLPQDVFARMCKVSTRTLANLEAEAGNPTMHSFIKIFRIFGMRLSLERTCRLGNQHQLITRLQLLGFELKEPETD
ncbi:helix-turn-helix domain-containing protein [Pseudomonas aeruginosa]|uniref:helix-turn-helix domain-containing protein n=1 Tax=Pseudomonas aeruginosa TaxID=287 RepID=UPI001E5B8B41|nr:helix-turn-helix transcriptional regulator [Pseudomonas aeruginosa]